MGSTSGRSSLRRQTFSTCAEQDRPALCRTALGDMDGSRIVGSVRERAEAPVADAIPWLFLGAKSVGAAGAFSNATSIQRVNTAGGTAPKADCSQAEAGKPVRVPYTADYLFFSAK